jgi:hypothetical protein
MVELEFVVVEFMIFLVEGVHPPPSKWIVFKTKELREEHFVSG